MPERYYFIPLNEIPDPASREAYSALQDIHAKREQRAIKDVLLKANFDPLSFIEFYNRWRTFTPKQLDFIHGVERRVRNYVHTNRRYMEDGSRGAFIALMGELYEDCAPLPSRERGRLRSKLAELKEGLEHDGQLLGSRYFSASRECLECLQAVPTDIGNDLTERLEQLETHFWSIYKEEQAATEQATEAAETTPV